MATQVVRMNKSRLLVWVIYTFFSTLAGMMGYEALKDIFDVTMTPWESRASTILFSCAIATGAASVVLATRQKLLDELARENLEHRQTEEALRREEYQFKSLIETAPEAIFVQNDDRFLYVNPAMQALLGSSSPDEVLGRNAILEHVGPLHEKEGPMPPVEQEYVRMDGLRVAVETTSVPIRFDGREAHLVFVRDITERKRAEERMVYLANHDALTGLPTLRLANDRLSMALKEANRNKAMVAVIFMDLDGFKAVNDTLGHEAGDYVLKDVARRFCSCVRETDTVARVGGDEFLIIAPGIHTPENAAKIAEKAISAVSQPIKLNGNQALVGTSIGIALYPNDGNDMEQLIKRADEAMYQVKKTGKNRYVFADSTK